MPACLYASKGTNTDAKPHPERQCGVQLIASGQRLRGSQQPQAGNASNSTMIVVPAVRNPTMARAIEGCARNLPVSSSCSRQANSTALAKASWASKPHYDAE